MEVGLFSLNYYIALCRGILRGKLVLLGLPLQHFICQLAAPVVLPCMGIALCTVHCCMVVVTSGASSRTLSASFPTGIPCTKCHFDATKGIMPMTL